MALGTKRRNDGRDARSLLGMTEHPQNVYARLAAVEKTTHPGRGGVRGGGDPNFGFEAQSPRVGNAVPTATWVDGRWSLGIDVTIIYAPPPDFIRLETMVVATAGHLGFDWQGEQPAPYASTYSLEDIGLIFGATYAVLVRAVTTSRGATRWSDPFTGVQFLHSVYQPGEISDLELDDVNINPPLGYGWQREGGYLGLRWDYLAAPDPDIIWLKWWMEADPQVIHLESLPGDTRGYYLWDLVIPDKIEFEMWAQTGELEGPVKEFDFVFPAEDVAEPASLELTENFWNEERGAAQVLLTVGASVPTPGQNPIDFYALIVAPVGEPTQLHILRNTLTIILFLTAGIQFTAQVYAVSTSGAVSNTIPFFPPTWTAAERVIHNLLPNPGFEQPSPRNEAIPARWNLTTGADGTAARVNTDQNSGQWSLKLTRDDKPGSFGQAVSEKIGAKPNKKYWIDYAVQIDSIGEPDNRLVYIQPFKADNTPLTEIALVNGPTPDWSERSNEFTAPALAAYIKVKLRTDDSLVDDMVYHYDSFFLREEVAGATLENNTIEPIKLVDVGPGAGTYGTPSAITMNGKGQVEDISVVVGFTGTIDVKVANEIEVEDGIITGWS